MAEEIRAHRRHHPQARVAGERQQLVDQTAAQGSVLARRPGFLELVDDEQQAIRAGLRAEDVFQQGRQAELAAAELTSPLLDAIAPLVDRRGRGAGGRSALRPARAGDAPPASG